MAGKSSHRNRSNSRLAGGEFHAAFGVEHPQPHRPGPDPAGQRGDEGPEDGAFTGAGRPGDEDLGAGQADGQAGAVFGHPDRQRQQIRRLLCGVTVGTVAVRGSRRRSVNTTSRPAGRG